MHTCYVAYMLAVPAIVGLLSPTTLFIPFAVLSVLNFHKMRMSSHGECRLEHVYTTYACYRGASRSARLALAAALKIGSTSARRVNMSGAYPMTPIVR